MAQMTVNKVLHGVTRALAQAHPDARIYDEEVPQELNPPAFFVKLLNMEQVQDLRNRYWRYHSFDIHYFDPTYSNVAMNDVAELLYDKMRLIDIDGRLHRGISMSHEIVDRVLHFFVDYNIKVKYVEPEAPKMEVLDMGENIKNKMVPAWLSWKQVDLSHQLKPGYDPNAPSTDLLNEILGENIWTSR